MPRTAPFTDTVLPSVVDSAISCRSAIASSGWGVSGSYEAAMSAVRSTDYDDSPWPTELHYGFRHLRAVVGGTPVVSDDYYWSAAAEDTVTLEQAIRAQNLIGRGMWGVVTDPTPSDDDWDTHSPDSAILQYLCYVAGSGSYAAQATYHEMQIGDYITLIQRSIWIRSTSDAVLGVVRTTNYYSASSPPDPPFTEESLVFDGSGMGSRMVSVDVRRIRHALEDFMSSCTNAQGRSVRLGSMWSVRGGGVG